MTKEEIFKIRDQKAAEFQMRKLVDESTTAPEMVRTARNQSWVGFLEGFDACLKLLEDNGFLRGQ